MVEKATKYFSQYPIVVQIVGLLAILIELVWLVWVIQREFDSPTKKLTAALGLFEYTCADQSARADLSEQLARQNIYVWPPNGMPLEMDFQDIAPSLIATLKRVYPHEYASLPAPEQDFLNKYTLPHLNRYLMIRKTTQSYLKVSELQSIQKNNNDQLLEVVGTYVDQGRYQWHGFRKTLLTLMVLDEKQNQYVVYFVSISDIADKLSFSREVAWPGGLLLLTAVLVILYNVHINRRQRQQYTNYLEKTVEERTEKLNSLNQHLQLEIDERKQLEQLMDKFVPHEFISLLNKQSILDVELGTCVQRSMTVLFADIRGFSTLSEAMLPDQNFQFLNEYLQRIGPVVRKHNGFIDKYIGDAIMALFPQSADEAIRAGIEMQRELITFNQERASAGKPPIQIGVGINTGELILGTIGETHRMEGTVISDAVNLAARMETLTKIYNASIIISENTLFALETPTDYHLRFVDRLNVKGKTKATTVYEIFDADSAEQRDLKHSTRPCFEKGWLYFHEEKYDLALKAFEQCLLRNPHDQPAHIYHQRCEHFLQGKPAHTTTIVDTNLTDQTKIN